eukprot:389601-Amphidinium_carterae.1
MRCCVDAVLVRSPLAQSFSYLSTPCLLRLEVKMASGELDSEARFLQFARQVNLADDIIDNMKAKGLTTAGTYAHACLYSPLSSDDSALRALMEQLAPGANLGTQAALRRLFTDCHTLFLADMKAHVEATGTEASRQVPMAERQERFVAQQKRFGQHFEITGDNEPSHQ